MVFRDGEIIKIRAPGCQTSPCDMVFPHFYDKNVKKSNKYKQYVEGCVIILCLEIDVP